MADERQGQQNRRPYRAKRMSDAAEKGNVPFSREVPLFATVLATFVYLIFFLPDRHRTDWRGAARHLRTAGPVEARDRAGRAVAVRRSSAGKSPHLLAPAIILFMTSSASPRRSPRTCRRRCSSAYVRSSRASRRPRAGRGCSACPGLIEFGKSLFKVVIVGVVMFFVLRSEYFGSIDAMFSDPPTLFARMMPAACRRLLIVVLFATAVGCHRRLLLDAASLVHRTEDDQAGGEGRKQAGAGRPDRKEPPALARCATVRAGA